MAEQNSPDTKLRTLASQISELDITTLLNPPKATPYTFDEANHFFENILAFYRDVSVSDFHFVPSDKLDSLATKADSVLKSLFGIRGFNVQDFGDPKRERQNCISRLSVDWQDAYYETVPHLAFAKVSSAAIAQEVEKLRATIDTSVVLLNRTAETHALKTKEVDTQSTERLAELNTVIDAARQASGKAAVSRQAREFEQEAQQCLVASRWWFGATIGTVVLSLIVIHFMFLKPFNTPTKLTTSAAAPTNQTNSALSLPPTPTETHAITVEALQQTVARILIVTLLYSAVVWCARNFFASRHNFTVNRHRRNAMQTFRAFVEGTSDPATQDFVLRQAAACAFAPQQSGYLKDESLPAPAPATQIIDVVKSGGGRE